jgi:hypothetical protein
VSVDASEHSEQSERTTAAPPGLGVLLAALGPLLIALAVTPAYPRLGDGASLLASALSRPLAGMDEHPLAALGARACALIPLGSLALRVNLSAALWLALAAAASYRALDLGLRALGLQRALLASPLALGAIWVAFGCAALQPSAVQDAAAAMALCALALERMTAALDAARPRARACANAALFWLVLLLIEHPALALAILLGAAPALLLGLGDRGALPTRRSELRVVLLLAPFAALAWYGSPAGAGHDPLDALELQAPSLAALRELGGSSGATARVLLAAGAIGIIRVRALRGPFGIFTGVGLVVALAACVAVEAKLLALALLPLAAMLAAGALARTLIGRPDGWLAHACAIGAVALGLSQLQAEGRRALPFDGSGNELLGDALRASVPPRALAMPAAATLHAQRAAELEERARPDLVLVPGPFRLDLHAANELERAHPELRELLRAQLIAPAHLLPELRAIAAQRPLLLEPDPGLPRELRAALVPHGAWHLLVTSDVSKAELRVASIAADAQLDRLLAQLDPAVALPELRAAVTALLGAAAEQAASAGDPERAQRLRERTYSWR